MVWRRERGVRVRALLLLMLLASCRSREQGETAPSARDAAVTVTVADGAEKATEPADREIAEGPIIAAMNHLGIAIYSELATRPGDIVLAPPALYSQLASLAYQQKGEPWRRLVASAAQFRDEEAFHRSVSHVLARRLGGGTAEAFNHAAPAQYLAISPAAWAVANAPRPEVVRRLSALYGVELRGFGSVEERTEALVTWSRAGVPDPGPPGVGGGNGLVSLSRAEYSASWAAPFNRYFESPGTFRASGGRRGPVTMLNRHSVVRYHEGESAAVLELQYWSALGSTVDLLLVRPVGSRPLATLERGLTMARIARWNENLEDRLLEVSVPRVQLRQTVELTEAVRRRPEAAALFAAEATAPAWQTAVPLEQVRHFADFSIDHGGTANTGENMPGAPGTMVRASSQVVFDRSFLFVVRDRESDLIYLIGRVSDVPRGPSK